MIDINQYNKNFAGFEMPDTLKQLVNFENSLHDEFFCQGFELGNFEDKIGIKTYSENPDFYNNLIEFATATGGGSTYAFWIRNNNKDLEQAPIVVLGDEGGVHPVAVNMLALLQILSYDVEPAVNWDEVYYFKSEEHEPSKQHSNYITWLSEHFGIRETNDADAIVVEAQNKFQEEFRIWMDEYYQQ